MIVKEKIPNRKHQKPNNINNKTYIIFLFDANFWRILFVLDPGRSSFFLLFLEMGTLNIRVSSFEAKQNDNLISENITLHT